MLKGCQNSLYEIGQGSLFLLTGGTQIINAQAAKSVINT